MIRVLRTVSAVREQTRSWRADNATVGSVMTMGALHEGHLSLIDAARSANDKVICTVFVNPLQFGPNGDFDRYPRDEDGDIAALRDRGCDAVFAPTVETMFPRGERSMSAVRTSVTVRSLTAVLCGPARPGHFDGVTTEVLKMLHIVDCDRTYLGEKDYQQYVVIRAMVEDLALPIDIVPCPTVRTPDGLALSSRNAYLTATERQTAPRLNATIRWAARRIADEGPQGVEDTVAAARSTLASHGFTVEYVDVLTNLLTPATRDSRVADLRVFVAAWLGSARLIDNVAVADEVRRPPC